MDCVHWKSNAIWGFMPPEVCSGSTDHESSWNTQIPEKKTGSCVQARLKDLKGPRALKMAHEMLRKNEKIRMYIC